MKLYQITYVFLLSLISSKVFLAREREGTELEEGDGLVIEYKRCELC